MRKTVLSLAFCFLSLFTVLGQSDPQLLFSNANAAYNGGNYTLAIEKYQAILVQDLHSAAVYFNLANAHYRQGNVAESVYYFEKAKQLDPTDSAIENNSRFAQNMTLDSIEELPKTQLASFKEFALGLFSLSTWSVMCVVLAWLAAFAFVFYRLSQRIFSKRLFFSLGLFFILFSLTTLVLTDQKFSQGLVQKAVIFEKEIDVWGEPNQRAEELFLLHEGTSVVVIDQLEGWVKIKLANGSEGWVQQQGIRFLD